MLGMRRSRPRLFVALDAGSVSGGAVAWSAAGFRLASHARVPLPECALAPAPFAPNVARPEEVSAALRELARTLRIGTTPVCLLLPDGLGRLALLEVPADVTPQQYARFRIVPGLPWLARACGICPDVNPTTTSRPSNAMHFVERSNASPPTGS